MKLYSIDFSNYGNIVKQTLLEEGFDFETVTTAPNQDPEYLPISPMGKIPAAETANGVLSETRAILSYIAASHPDNTLFPKDAFAIARLEELYSLVDLYIEHQARRQLPEAMFGAPRDEATYADVKPKVERGLKALGSRFSPSPYVHGEFSVADIYLFHCLGLAATVMEVSYGWDILAEIDGMKDWFELVKSRKITESVLAERDVALAALRARLTKP